MKVNYLSTPRTIIIKSRYSSGVCHKVEILEETHKTILAKFEKAPSPVRYLKKYFDYQYEIIEQEVEAQIQFSFSDFSKTEEE